MGKAFDANGVEIEVFTKEELEAREKTMKEAHDQQVNRLKGDLAALNEKLAVSGGADKDQLLKDKQELEKKISDQAADFTKQITTLKDNMFAGLHSKALKALTGGNAEKEAKIKEAYGRLTGYTDDEAGIIDRYRAAATLVEGKSPSPNFMDGVSSAGVRGDQGGDQGGGQGAMTDNAKAMQKALGVSDADVEKYGKKE